MCARSHRADRIASIIVSDEPLSRETNYRTEFVAVLNNQPQGGFITRRPTVEVPVASGDDFGNNGFGFFSSAIGTPNPNSNPLATPVRAPANTINRCNSACGRQGRRLRDVGGIPEAELIRIKCKAKFSGDYW